MTVFVGLLFGTCCRQLSSSRLESLLDYLVALFLHTGIEGACVEVDFGAFQSCCAAKCADDCARRGEGDSEFLDSENVNDDVGLEDEW